MAVLMAEHKRNAASDLVKKTLNDIAEMTGNRLDCAAVEAQPMGYIGTVSEGKVILPPDVSLPEGACVQVLPLAQPTELEGLTAELLRLAHKSRDLPADLAQNHDHYLHGQPKQ